MSKSTKIIALVAIVSLAVGVFGLLLASGWPNYGACANGTFKITKVYQPNDDQVVSENSKNYMFYPFNKMGDVIPKEKALFIAFVTYSSTPVVITTLQLWNDIKQMPLSFPKEVSDRLAINLDRDVSLLVPLDRVLEHGQKVELKLLFSNGLSCTWQGIVE